MAKNQGIHIATMTKRIVKREDNLYDSKVIKKILYMYMDEVRQALLKGERVQLSSVGTIIPEVKVRKGYNLSLCNKEEGNPPYTRLRMTRCSSLRQEMNNALVENVENGVYGLEKLPLEKQQIAILKDSGYIPCDEEIEEDETD